MLAACLDAAAPPTEHHHDKNSNSAAAQALTEHVIHCLEKGLPELKGEFSIELKRVWRGKGSIAAKQVMVQSRYQHAPAPVPQEVKDQSTATQVHDHSHSHGHSHSHSHSHGHSSNHEHNDGEVAFISHDHSHSPRNKPLRNLPEIKGMLNRADAQYITPWVKQIAIQAFEELAMAEAYVHGVNDKSAVHFHEVGAVDSIVDTVGTCIALDALGIQTVSCSRLPLGEGTVHTDHGILPVPAPATLRLMTEVLPATSGPPGITGELVTPTAAALLRVLRIQCPGGETPGRPPQRFTVQRVGIGAGSKDFHNHPNILRILIGRID